VLCGVWSMEYCSSASARSAGFPGLLGDRGVNTEESRMARTENVVRRSPSPGLKERVMTSLILVPPGLRSEREKILQVGERGLQEAVGRFRCI
jgi:hypothetical protein